MRHLRRSFFLIVFMSLALILPTSAQSPGSGGVFPPPQWATDDIFAIVAVASGANVRTAPSVETGLIIGVIEIGERFRVRGYVDEQDWWLLEVNGQLGWVSYDGILVTNAEDTAALDGPLSLTPAQQASLDAQVTLARNQVASTVNLNIRQGPSTRNARIGLLPFGARANIMGRTPFGTWLLIEYNGTIGWVSTQFVVLPFGLPLDAIPIAQ